MLTQKELKIPKRAEGGEKCLQPEHWPSIAALMGPVSERLSRYFQNTQGLHVYTQGN